MMTRFVQFMGIAQRYNAGLMSPYVWSHMYPKQLKIINKLSYLYLASIQKFESLKSDGKEEKGTQKTDKRRKKRKL